jgi:hypothetical protein
MLHFAPHKIGNIWIQPGTNSNKCLGIMANYRVTENITSNLICAVMYTFEILIEIIVIIICKVFNGFNPFLNSMHESILIKPSNGLANVLD